MTILILNSHFSLIINRERESVLVFFYSLAIERPLHAFVFNPEVASQTRGGREGAFAKIAREPLQLLNITTSNNYADLSG